jgi:hypothetical protein
MDEHVAFIETFGRDLSYRLVTHGELLSRALAKITLRRRLKMVDLTGAGLATLGADARLCTGSYAVAQVWSAAFWSHPAEPDGLLWRSRFDPERFCVAVFNRAANDLMVSSAGHLARAQHRALLGSILDTYQFGYVETP